MREVGCESHICATLAELASALSDDVVLVIITEDAVRNANLQALIGWIKAQPPWSDVPIILLTDRSHVSEHNSGAVGLFDTLGNVTLLERPFRPRTFVSLVRTALKGRFRQYEAKQRLEELRESEDRLRIALNAGQLGAWELDVASNELLSSAECKANFGRGPDEAFSFADLLTALHPDDRALWHAKIASSVQPIAAVSPDSQTQIGSKRNARSAISTKIATNNEFFSAIASVVSYCGAKPQSRASSTAISATTDAPSTGRDNWPLNANQARSTISRTSAAMPSGSAAIGVSGLKPRGVNVYASPAAAITAICAQLTQISDSRWLRAISSVTRGGCGKAALNRTRARDTTGFTARARP